MFTLFVVLAARTVHLIWLRPSGDQLADLHVYWGTARAISRGVGLYDFHAPNGDPFTYPPFAMVLFWPLSLIPEVVARVVWTLATVAALPALAWALTRATPPRSTWRHPAVWWAGSSVLLMSAPGQSNIRFGQVSIFVVLLALLDAGEITPPRWRGVLIGIAAAIKLTPLLFIAYLLITGKRRDAARAALAFTGCAALAAAILPGASVDFWTSALFTTSRVGDLSSLGNQSINGALLRMGLSDPIRSLLWVGLAGACCVLALVQARRAAQAGHPLAAAVIIGCATIAGSPVSWMHHQFWTVAAGIALVVVGPTWRTRWAGVAVILVMTVKLSDYLGGLALIDDSRGLVAMAVGAFGLGRLPHITPVREDVGAQGSALAPSVTNSM